MSASLLYRLGLLVAGCCLVVMLASMSASAQKKAKSQTSKAQAAAKLHPQDFEAQMKAAVAYYNAGNYAQAEVFLKRALALKPNDLDALTGMANTLYDQGRYAAAQLYYEKALAQKPDPDVQTDLGNTYFKRGDYPSAIVEYRKAIALNPQHEKSWQNLAVAAIQFGDMATAREATERLAAINPDNPALPISRAALEPPTPQPEPTPGLRVTKDQKAQLAQAAKLNQRALELYEAGRYAEALPLAQSALAIVETALGPESPSMAKALYNLASVYFATGDYTRALPLYQRALTIQEKVLGPEHPNIATNLNNLAKLFHEQGNFDQAEPLYIRALTIQEKVLGPVHSEVATTLHNLAGLYNEQGNYTRALLYYQRSLAIEEKVFEPEHPTVAVTLSSLASVYFATGDYARAVLLSERALAIWEKALGKKNPTVALALNNLALMYQAQGNNMRAVPLYQRALAIWQKDSAGHPLVVIALTNLATLYYERGNYDKAAPLFQRALAVAEKTPEPEYSIKALALLGVAVMYQAQGSYDKAAPIFQRILAITEKAIGPEHPNIAALHNNLAGLYQAKGDYERAISLLQRTAEVREKTISRLLTAGSQQQKQLYLNTISAETDNTVSLHAQVVPQNSDATRLALTVILQRKGRALDAFSDQIAALRQRANPDDQKLLDELAATLTRLANLQLGKDSKLAPDALRAEVARLDADKERLEDAISRRSAEFRALAQPVTLDAVQKALPADAALVEFFVYHPFNPKAKPNEQYGASRYIAYLLKRDATAPQWADLGDAATIDAEAAKFRNALQSDKSAVTQVKQLARNLDARLMQPVRKLLGTTKRVFLSPDSALNLIPFAALVDENGQYLVENYSFNYLTSGRDLLRLQITGKSESGASVVANPQFDLTQPVVNCKAGQRGLGLLSDTPDAKIDYRGTDFTQYCYSTLAWTAQEAAQLGPLLTDAKVLTQKDATEAALKALHRPRLLHIATHGFFFPDLPNAECGMRNADCPHAGPPARNLGLNPPSAFHNPQSENPLLRSGLILAGVKQRRSGPENDGVLTALEAAGLDLFGTKLVVLSACETGLGEVQNGAGVYGLRRALVLAGSETQIMSLWKVSDAATRDLMTSYYTRLQRGEGRSEAMRQVQLELLRNGKLATPVGESRKIEQEGEKGKTSPADWRHPYYWAAFIQSGAGTNLDGR